jgi:Fe-S cluster assembly iron-binding protein IscA
MMTLTPTAAQAVRALVTNLDVDEQTAGLRISSGDPTAQGAALQLALVNAPEPSDQTIQADGASVFLEPSAAAALDGKQLDASVDSGRVQFVLLDDAGPPATDGGGPNP